MEVVVSKVAYHRHPMQEVDLQQKKRTQHEYDVVLIKESSEKSISDMKITPMPLNKVSREVQTWWWEAQHIDCFGVIWEIRYKFHSRTRILLLLYWPQLQAQASKIHSKIQNSLTLLALMPGCS